MFRDGSSPVVRSLRPPRVRRQSSQAVEQAQPVTRPGLVGNRGVRVPDASRGRVDMHLVPGC
jgi:hypothetical protein